MIAIPEEVKELLKQGSVRKNFRVHFPNGEREDITNENIVEESVSLTESICSQNSLVFGLCETPQIEFETVGVENIRGAEIECYIEIECDPDVLGSMYQPDINMCVYPIPYGKFVVDSCKKQADMTHRQISAYGTSLTRQFTEILNIYKMFTSKFYWFDKKLSINAETLVKICKNVVTEETELSFSEGKGNTTITYNGENYSVEYEVKKYGRPPTNSAVTFRFLPEKGLYSKIKENEVLSYIYENHEDFFYNFDTLIEYENGFSLESGTNSFDLTTKKEVLHSISEYKNATIFPFCELSDGYNDNGGTNILFQFYYLLTRIKVTYPDGTIVDTGSYPNNKVLYSDLGNFFDTGTQWGNRFLIPLESKSTKVDMKKYGATTTSKKTVYKYDFSKILELNIDEVVNSYCELKGGFGITHRDGTFEISYIYDNFNTMSAGVLEPSECLSVWYEDESSKPIGRIECDYKIQNQTEHEIIDFASSFAYSMYSSLDVSNNYFIKNGTFESDVDVLYLLMEFDKHNMNIAYMPMEITTVGRPDIEVGDVYDVILKDGTHFKGFVEQRTLHGIQALSDTVVSKDEYASVRSGSTGSSRGGIVAPTGMQSKVLWENPSPSSSFAGQTVTLNDEVENFDYIGFIFARGSSNAENRSMVLPLLLVPVDGVFTGARMTLAGYRNYVRDVTAMSENKVTFGGGTYYATYGTNTTTASNTTLTPRLVIGFKE